MNEDTFDADVPMADPFLSLVTKLDDIAPFPNTDPLDFDMDSWQEAGPSRQEQSTSANQHSPPQEFYESEGTPPSGQRHRDVSSLHSLLHHPHDEYYGMRFSPPNFDIGSHSGSGRSIASHAISPDGPASMLSAIHSPGYPGDAYRPIGLAAQLAAAPMTPRGNQLYVSTNGAMGGAGGGDEKNMHAVLSPPLHLQHQQYAEPMEQHLNGYMPSYHAYGPYHIANGHSRIVAPRAQRERPQEKVEAVEDVDEELDRDSPKNMKEELLRLLVNMSPSDVERLKNKKLPKIPKKEKLQEQEIMEDDVDEDDESDGEPGREGSSSTTVIVRRPKTERRTAHNLIEKKYRCSINDRIQQLKVLLCGDEAKLSKSMTLRRAIEHIEELESENALLKFQVDHMRRALQTHGLPYPDPIQLAQEFAAAQSLSDSSPSPPRNERKRSRMSGTPLKMSMGKEGSSRVTLFAMLMAVLIFNPLGLLAGSATMIQTVASGKNGEVKAPIASPFEHGRVIDDTDGSYTSNQPTSWHEILISIFNIVIICSILMSILMLGDPVQDFMSPSWQKFVSDREKARAEWTTGNLKGARRQFVDCLGDLKRALPSPGVDAVFSVVWECIRHFLNWLWIGRWIARRKRSTAMPVSLVCRSHAQTAVLYHEIHQIHLMGITDESDPHPSLSGLYLALCAVNLAEAAGASADGLPRAIMAQIYLAASIRCRLALPKLLAPFFSIYFLKRARRHVRRAPEHTVSHLKWLFHPVAQKYMSDAKRMEHVLTSKKLRFGAFVEDEQLTPLARIRTTFKVYLLSKLVQELAGGEEVFTKNVERILNDNDRLDDEVDVVDVSRLLVSMSTQCTGVLTNEKDESAKFGSWLSRSGDACCTWWTHVLTCGIYWRGNKNELARQHYSLIRNCPPELLTDNLALALGHALCARKICIDDRDSAHLNNFVCHHTRQALQSLRLFSTSRSSGVISGIQEGTRRMAYEWVMNSLLDSWRINLNASKPYWTQNFKSQQVYSTLYQEAFNHYALINRAKGDCWRIFVYELTCRMLNGANPQATWSGVRRVRSTKMDAVRGRVSMKRSSQPDAFHLHTLVKLHSSMDL